MPAHGGYKAGSDACKVHSKPLGLKAVHEAPLKDSLFPLTLTSVFDCPPDRRHRRRTSGSAVGRGNNSPSAASIKHEHAQAITIAKAAGIRASRNSPNETARRMSKVSDALTSPRSKGEACKSMPAIVIPPLEASESRREKSTFLLNAKSQNHIVPALCTDFQEITPMIDEIAYILEKGYKGYSVFSQASPESEDEGISDQIAFPAGPYLLNQDYNPPAKRRPVGVSEMRNSCTRITRQKSDLTASTNSLIDACWIIRRSIYIKVSKGPRAVRFSDDIAHEFFKVNRLKG